MSAKAIGGYFGWEFPEKKYPLPHEEGFFVNNARSALQLILQSIGKVCMVYIPFYTCDSVTAALDSVGIAYRQYHIDSRLRIAEDIHLQDDEYLIYTNYFGIMDAYCGTLAGTYGSKLIVDNAQALYAQHINGTHSIYSCRKFIGVPDGGIAISEATLSAGWLPEARSYDRCGALLARAEEDIPTGYKLFKANDQRFREDGIARMSMISEKILQSINHENIIRSRRRNFEYLHSALKGCNRLSLPETDTFSCPLVYPFYTDNPEMRRILIENEIFVAQYWPNVLDWCERKDAEYGLTKSIMALPVDQRYDTADMQTIINVINSIDNI